jgi:hypothetical protein
MTALRQRHAPGRLGASLEAPMNPLRSEQEAFSFLIRAVAVIAVIVVVVLVLRAVL